MLKWVSKLFFQEISVLDWLLIILGTVVWSLTMVKSGLLYSFGMGFWGPNGHDGVWHISLAQSLANGSWNIPVFAGEPIKNYHVGFDLILAAIHKLTFIPVHNLYFQVLPPIFAFLIGLFVYLFTLNWKNSKTAAFWATFFVYFGGNWGWVVTLSRSGGLGGESMFWSQQSISTLLNPPFALSFLLIILGLLLLTKGLKVNDKKLLTIATFIFGVLVQIKVYAGILVLAGLFAAGCWRMAERKGITLMKVFTGSLIFSILLFSPSARDVGQILIFKPFWFLEGMMQFADRFYWPKLGEAMVNYKLARNFIKGLPAYVLAFSIFWFGNLGTRVIKEFLVFKWFKDFRKMTYIEVIFTTIIVLGVFIPVLFIQRGTAWNTIQFMYYSLMFSGILAGVWLGKFIKNSKLNNKMIYIIVAAVVLLTIPTAAVTLWFHFLPPRPPAKISWGELEALEFLSKQADGTVLTQVFDREAANAVADNPPRPLYLYESSAYVSAFSAKPVYLEDEVNLEITGYDWRERRRRVEEFFENPNEDFLADNNIRYVYLVKDLKQLDFANVKLKKIFEDKEVEIFKLD